MHLYHHLLQAYRRDHRPVKQGTEGQWSIILLVLRPRRHRASKDRCRLGLGRLLQGSHHKDLRRRRLDSRVYLRHKDRQVLSGGGSGTGDDRLYLIKVYKI